MQHSLIFSGSVQCPRAHLLGAGRLVVLGAVFVVFRVGKVRLDDGAAVLAPAVEAVEVAKVRGVIDHGGDLGLGARGDNASRAARRKAETLKVRVLAISGEPLRVNHRRGGVAIEEVVGALVVRVSPPILPVDARDHLSGHIRARVVGKRHRHAALGMDLREARARASGSLPKGQRRRAKLHAKPYQRLGPRAGVGRCREGHRNKSKSKHRRVESECGGSSQGV